MRLLILITLATLLLTGCDLFDSQAQKEKKIAHEREIFQKKVADEKDIQLKKISEQTQRELALLESKKELASIEKEKELAKIKFQAELQKQKIQAKKEQEEAIFSQKMQQRDQINNMELKRYLVLIFALFIGLTSYFLFYYFKKRREDKLRAYNDNLEKYFHHKENEARVKIAEKMLDAISAGTLDKSQENQLISAFSGQSNESYQQQLESHSTINNEEDKDADIIEVVEDKTNQ